MGPALVSEGRGGSGVLGRDARGIGARWGGAVVERGVTHRTCSFPNRYDRASHTRDGEWLKAPPNFTRLLCHPRAACWGSKRIVRDTPIDTHRQPTPLVMQKKLLMLSALMVALACAHAGETPEVTNKVRHAPTHAPASSSSSDN